MTITDIENLLNKAVHCELDGDYTGAVNALNEATKYDVPMRGEAYYRLGELYLGGKMGEPDKVKAADYYKKAKTYGNILASLKLCELNGETDAELIKKLESEAQRYAAAAYIMGTLHEEGKIVEKSAEKALQYYKQGSKLGEPESSYRLGEAYFYGQLGQQKNEKTAFEYYKAAATKGNIPAMTMVGLYYQNGIDGIQKSTEEAIKWYKKAADAGDPKAKKFYGILTAPPKTTPQPKPVQQPKPEPQKLAEPQKPANNEELMSDGTFVAIWIIAFIVLKFVLGAGWILSIIVGFLVPAIIVGVMSGKK